MLNKLAVIGLVMTFVWSAQAQDAPKEMKGDMKVDLKGYVVDAMCATGMLKKDDPMAAASKHTKGCALEEGCAASGYGVFSDGKWYKFDEAGDKMAMDLIQKTSTNKGIMVEVKGMMKGEAIAVSEISEYHEE